MFRARIHPLESDEYKALKVVLNDIVVIDDTFSYSIIKGTIYMFDEDKTRLMKRCVWLHHKVNKNIKFDVLEFEEEKVE